MKPHKHAELIKAWADGAEIEYLRMGNEGWAPIFKGWSWDCDFAVLYRIKPERKPDVLKNFMFVEKMGCAHTFIDVTGLPRNEGEQWIRVYMDGETGEIKSAEVLK
jgi:hypothetical protein